MPVLKPILLSHWRSPGDVVLLTGAVRDLAKTYPGRYEIHVASACPELWQNNPHVSGIWGTSPPRHLPLFPISYRRYLAEANTTRQHFSTAFHRELATQLKVEFPILDPCGDLHLSVQERASSLVDGRYWLFIAGGKRDIQTKIWPWQYAQRLVMQLANHGIRVVQAGAVLPGHLHSILSGVENLVGKTSLRDLIRLVQHADGVICPVTCVMHMAAALHRPCVVIAGGREPWWWECYQNLPESLFGPSCARVQVPHQFLHTQGKFRCCEQHGCWKTKLRAHEPFNPDECVLPVLADDQIPVPACLVEITPEMVVESVMSYYRDGTLQPIGNAD